MTLPCGIPFSCSSLLNISSPTPTLKCLFPETLLWTVGVSPSDPLAVSLLVRHVSKQDQKPFLDQKMLKLYVGHLQILSEFALPTVLCDLQLISLFCSRFVFRWIPSFSPSSPKAAHSTPLLSYISCSLMISVCNWRPLSDPFPVSAKERLCSLSTASENMFHQISNIIICVNFICAISGRFFIIW